MYNAKSFKKDLVQADVLDGDSTEEEVEAVSEAWLKDALKFVNKIKGSEVDWSEVYAGGSPFVIDFTVPESEEIINLSVEPEIGMDIFGGGNRDFRGPAKTSKDVIKNLQKFLKGVN